MSAVEFRTKGFVERICEILRERALEPHHLQLELTETVLIGSADAASVALQALSGMGVGFALDDFGMGFSSLSYLKRFPIDTLKIDQ